METSGEEPRSQRRKQTRISGLEQQLADASRSEERHQAAETNLRAALAYAESIVATVREPLLVLDDTLRVRTASRAFYNTFGGAPEDTEGQLMYELGNGQWDIPALRALLEKVLSERAVFKDFEVVHDFPVLGKRAMLVNARPLRMAGDNSHMVLVAVEDITERRRIQQELVRSNEDLQRIAYAAAHDLRSPVNAAFNLIQMLARRVKGKLDEQETEILRHSTESLERLSKLMNDILLLAESDMGDAPRQPAVLSLEEPLRFALANLQHHIEHSGATVTVGALPTVSADRTQMVIVFQNLIGNAIKYRGEDPPLIGVSAVQGENEWVVSVTDNGQGFEARHAIAIFEPFKRLHGAKVPGSGIGLATCKRIVERSGGRIWAESTPGRGSTFNFTMPGVGDHVKT